MTKNCFLRVFAASDISNIPIIKNQDYGVRKRTRKNGQKKDKVNGKKGVNVDGHTSKLNYEIHNILY